MAPGRWSLNAFTGFGIWADGNGRVDVAWSKQSSPSTALGALLPFPSTPQEGPPVAFPTAPSCFLALVDYGSELTPTAHQMHARHVLGISMAFSL